MSEYYRMPMASYDADVGVDRDGERIIGAVVMEMGDISSLDARRQYVDAKTMEQFVALASSADAKHRARFTHGGPGGIGGEGLGTYLGRWSNARIDGNKVRWDLQLSPRSHDSVRGDIGKYTLDMSESDPDMLGVSMVATLDHQAMRRDRRSDGAMPIRLRSLHGADIVDTPALASGMFAAGQTIGEEEMPETNQGGITQEQFDAGLKAGLESFGKLLTESILSQVAEKFAVKQQPVDEIPSPDALRKEGAKLAASIMAYAATSGLADHEKLAGEAIDKGLSLEAFKASITDRLVATNGLTRDGGDQPDDPESKYKAEYRSQRAAFTAMGLTEAEYITSRKIEDGSELLAPSIA